MDTGPRAQRPRPATRRGAATRARIIDAATVLVMARGVERTSLDDVLAASATSKSQLYHYFADKGALMCAVIRAQSEQVIGFHAPFLRQVDSLAGLRRWRDAVVELTRAKSGIGGCPMGSLASELADRCETSRDLLVESFAAWEQHLAAGLRAMRDRGDLAPDADPDDLATAISGALQGDLLLARTTRTTRPLELALDMALAHVERHGELPKPPATVQRRT